MLAPYASRQGALRHEHATISLVRTGAEGEPEGELRQAVLAHLHLHAYEFSVAECQDGQGLPDRHGRRGGWLLVHPAWRLLNVGFAAQWRHARAVPCCRPDATQRSACAAREPSMSPEGGVQGARAAC